jgi:hypothetical protein
MRNAFLILLGACILVNSFQLGVRILSHSQQQSGFLGDQFAPLLPVFANVRKAGYYTDKDLNDARAIAQFEQAQYVLAPTVLDLNNTNHPLVILDCSSPQAAKQKLEELGLKAISMSNSGIVLAVNPQLGDFKL